MNLTELSMQIKRAAAAGDSDAVARLSAQVSCPKAKPIPRPGEWPDFGALNRSTYENLLTEHRQLIQKLRIADRALGRKGEALAALEADHRQLLRRYQALSQSIEETQS